MAAVLSGPCQSHQTWVLSVRECFIHNHAKGAFSVRKDLFAAVESLVRTVSEFIPDSM